MRLGSLLLTGALVVPLAAAVPGARAQDTAEQTSGLNAETSAPAGDAAASDADLLDDAALDDLLAPVALFPDSLLTQILVAATLPLEVVKADRFLDENADLSDKDRAAKAEAEGWDPSVAVLAGGFPTVIARMADEIDWTENLGDAVMAQSEDVLDAVQRLREQAAVAGNLTSNAAQTVDDTGDTITIEPTDPSTVYVPTYDPGVVYTAPPAQPVAAPAPVPVTTTTVDSGWSAGDVLATGAIAFGSALLIDEIFNEDDDWDDYWRGPPPIDWDEDNFRPRPGVTVNGDVTIDRDRNRVRIDSDGKWKPTPEQRQAAQGRIANREAEGRGLSQAQRDTLKARSPDRAGAARVQAAGKSGDARSKLQAASEKQKATNRPSALQPADRDRPKAKAAADRGATSLKHDKAPSAVKARTEGAAKAKQVSKPKVAKHPERKAAPRASAFDKPSGGGGRAKAASSRGHAHRQRK